ncbi:MAG: InlB B-repeat-containing protein, partial [Eubacteriales bacterium]
VGWTPTDTIPTGSTGPLTFTALWVLAPFAVNYETGVAAVVTNMPADVPAVLYTTPYVVSAVIPVRAGFTFVNWATTNVNGTAQTYTGGGTFAMPANDVTLTATWVADLSPVNYHPNGGVGADYTEGLHATLSLVTVDANSFTRPGYQFIGWSETPTGPITQQPGNTFVMPTVAVDFYAQWEQVFYTVTYMVTGGTLDGLDGDTPFATYGGLAYGDAVPVPSDPAQEGYTFDGWTTAIPATMPEGNVTIYGTLTQITLRAEEIPDEPTPLATPTWALLNLILMIVTALAIVIIFTLLKKNREVELTKKSKAFRWSTLVPAIGAVVAFVLTEDMRNPMVLTDNWTILMAGIAVVQALLLAFGLQKDKKRGVSFNTNPIA